MGLALDEPKDDDEKIAMGPLTFLLDKNLANLYDIIRIDYRDSWFGKGFTVSTGGSC